MRLGGAVGGSGGERGRLIGWDLFALAAVALGLVLRLRFLLSRQTLWLDEAMLALNVLGRPYRELLGPLDYDQAAPPLFLWIARLTGHAAGGSPVALRGVAFVCGVAVLLLTWRLARRHFSPEVGAFAALFVAVSPTLIYYSGEFKPYMGDAAVGLGLLALASRVGASPTRVARWLMLLGAGLLSLGLSFTAPFYLATVGVALLGGGLLQDDRRLAVGAAVLGAGWLAGFGILHTWYAGTVAANPYLQEFWAREFLGHSEFFIEAAWRIIWSFSAPLPVVMHEFPTAGLVILLGVAGVLALRGSGVIRIGLLAAPGLMALLASLANQYPVDIRLFVFAAPLTLVVVAAGLASGLQLGLSDAAVRGGVAAGVVLVVALASGSHRGRGPGLHLGDPAAIELIQGRPAGALAYILPSGGPKWVYVTTDWTAPDQERLAWYATVLSWGGPAFRNTGEATGFAPVVLPALRPPSSSDEILAYAAGVADSVALPAWANAEVRRLLGTGAREAWLYAGIYHDRMLPGLIMALERSGVAWQQILGSNAEVVLRLTLPVAVGGGVLTPRP